MTDQVTQEQIEQARANLTGFGVNPDQLPLEQICGLVLHFKPQKTQFDHMREMREANQKRRQLGQPSGCKPKPS